MKHSMVSRYIIDFSPAQVDVLRGSCNCDCIYQAVGCVLRVLVLTTEFSSTTTPPATKNQWYVSTCYISSTVGFPSFFHVPNIGYKVGFRAIYGYFIFRFSKSTICSHVGNTGINPLFHQTYMRQHYKHKLYNYHSLPFLNLAENIALLDSIEISISEYQYLQSCELESNSMVQKHY